VVSLAHGPSEDGPIHTRLLPGVSTDRLAGRLLARYQLPPYLFLCLLFLLLVVFTRSSILNDTVNYADDIRASEICSSLSQCPQLWDAGHLIWRPLGHFLFPPLLPLLKPFVGGDVPMAIDLLLMLCSGFALFIATLLLYSILVSETGDVAKSLFVTTAFLCAEANLYALHSGTPYPAGLACLIGAVWCARTGVKTDRRSVVFAGLLGGLAVAFWLPYVVALPALLCWVLFHRPLARASTALILFLSTAFTGVLLFGLAAQFRQIGSVSGFHMWLSDSAHGTEQNRNLFRALFGLPRSFMDMGQFGLTMKQYLLRDPYANVRLAELLRFSLLKVFLFYAVLISLAFLWRIAKGKKLLIVLGVAFLANMTLAVFFEGGSPERYFPLYPFFFIAAGQCLCLPQISRPVRLLLVSVFLIIIVGNLPSSFVSSIHAEENKTAQRIRPLLPLPPESLIIALTNDNVSWLRQNGPLYEINRGSPSFRFQSLYLPMTQTLSWKQDFAARVLAAWAKGGQIWVTNRVSYPKPRQEWNWVEGDDPNVGWAGIVNFFRPLDRGPVLGGEDGFFLLSRSTANYSALSSIASQTGSTIGRSSLEGQNVKTRFSQGPSPN